MGVIQNIADRFYMTIGKTRKVYPVKVEKHRIQGKKDPSEIDGDVDTVLEGIDRGRTLIDDDGNMKFELMNEPQAEGLVKYEDFSQDLGDTKYVAVLMVDRKNFVPAQRTWNFADDFENSGVSELEYVLKTPKMKEHAVNQFEEDSKIVETDEKKWWQNPKMQSAILFIGAGLFFVLLAFARSEFYVQPLTEQMAGLETALKNAGSSLGGS